MRVRWLVAGLFVAAALAAGTWWLLTKDSTAKGSDIAAVLALPVAILGLGAAVLAVLVRPASIGDRTWVSPIRMSLDHAADELAEQVRQQWEQAAGERGLMFPALIALRWRWSRRHVTGPVAAAVAGARFAPLPGMVAITVKKLSSGTIKDLLGVYGGLGSGRLVILGGPGAGKSGAAIRLLLDALTHRAAFGNADERARVPVPVLFTLHGWDPRSEPLTCGA